MSGLMLETHHFEMQQLRRMCISETHHFNGGSGQKKYGRFSN